MSEPSAPAPDRAGPEFAAPTGDVGSVGAFDALGASAVPGRSAAPGVPGSPAPHDALATVLADLAAIDDVPLMERAAVFERMHEVITETLSGTVERPGGAR